MYSIPKWNSSPTFQARFASSSTYHSNSNNNVIKIDNKRDRRKGIGSEYNNAKYDAKYSENKHTTQQQHKATVVELSPTESTVKKLYFPPHSRSLSASGFHSTIRHFRAIIAMSRLLLRLLLPFRRRFVQFVTLFSSCCLLLTARPVSAVIVPSSTSVLINNTIVQGKWLLQWVWQRSAHSHAPPTLQKASSIFPPHSISF